MCLREKAISWYHTLDNIVGFNKNSWDDLKAEFLNAYAPRFTARTLCTSFQDLRQKTDENVQDFYNRLSDVFRDAYQVKPPVVLTHIGERYGATNAQANEIRLKGVMAMQLLVMNTVFLGGLREEIRTKVLEQGPTEIRDSVKLARELEVIVHDRKRGSQISSILEEDADEDNEQYDEEEEELISFINAIRARKGKRPFQRSGSRGRGGQRGRGGYGNYTSNITVKCRYCKITGHFQRDCRKRQAANAPMVDVNGKPLKINSIQEQQEEEDQWNALN